MIKKLAAKIWKKLPPVVRMTVIRLTQKKFTASVGAVVTDKSGKILLLDHLLRPGSGWGMPGGFIEHGEQPEEALKRELCEETGLELKNIELFRARIISRHIEFIFRAEAGEGKAEVKSREIKQVKWFEPDEVPEELSKAQKKIIKQVLKLNRD